MSTLGNKTFTGSLWVIFSKWIIRFFGIISTAILARIYSPEDFGIVAIALLVMAFLEVILQNGTENYLIRQEHINSIDYDTAWSIRLVILIIMAMILGICSESLSDFFQDSKLIYVFYFLSFVLFISAFENIGMVIHRKNFNFRIIFWFNILKKISGFVTTVALAFYLKNYWAVIIGLFTFRFTAVILSYILSTYRPSFRFTGFKRQWNFSKWVLLNNITNLGRQKSEQIVISKMLGVGDIGLYSLAQQIASIPMTELIQPLMITLYSAYSDILKNIDQLSLVFIKVIGIISNIVLPLLTGLFILSPMITTLFLGNNWGAVVPILKLMIVITGVQIYITIISNLLTALDKVKIIAIVNWVLIIILIPSMIYIAIDGNLEELILGRTALAIIFLPVFIVILLRSLSIKTPLLIMAVIRPAVSSVFMGFSIYYLDTFLSDYPDIVRLFSETIAGVVIYSITVITLWFVSGMNIGGEDFILDKFARVLAKFSVTSTFASYIFKTLKNHKTAHHL